VLTATIDRWGTVKLSWRGANGSTVEVFRNGARIAVVENSGAYTERVRVKTGSYTYVVCESGGSRCSPAVTVPLPERRLASVHTRVTRHHLKHRKRSAWVLLFRNWP